jgi:hypothetical protein
MPIGGFSRYVSTHIDIAKRSKWPSAQIDILIGTKTLASDNEDEIMISLSTIHNEIVRSIKVAAEKSITRGYRCFTV